MSGWRDALGREHRPVEGVPRIVSLVPSLTELVCALGLADRLVGRTGFCIHPREIVRAIPKVGGTKDVAVDKVRALAPTHVAVNVDENRREQVEEIARFVPHVIVTHPLKPEDNIELFRLFGGVFRAEARARQLADELAGALAALREAVRELPRERVLYLIWKKPWMTVSRQTYISAMLAQAGWDTLPAAGDTRYPTIDGDEAWLAEADRVLLSTEPYRFREKHLAEIAALPALAGKPAQLIDGEMVSWYGSRAIAGLRYLSGLRA